MKTLRSPLALISFFILSCTAAFCQAPTITSVTPTTATAGTQVTIAGSGFGAAQGSGNVWLGNTYGTVVSWSDAQVVASVASGAKSGTAQVLQGGVWSNSLDFTVVTPTITNVTPTSGAPGTQVTITGTGFGATQGGGNVWLGNTYGTVLSWSDTQVVATVAAGAQSGTVQILQGGVWSNSVNFSASVSVVSITLTPSNPSITLNSSQQVRLVATGVYSDGTSKDISSTVTWGTSNSSIARVLPNPNVPGVIVAIAVGQANVTASYNGISTSTLVTVLAAPAPSNPAITSVSPMSGVAGTQVVITGS